MLFVAVPRPGMGRYAECVMMRISWDYRPGTILLGMVLLAGLIVFPAAASSTAMFHLYPWHSGDYSSVSGGILPNGLLKWAFQTGGSVESSPVVADGVVYVGSSDRNVYAIDAATGIQKWAYETGSVVVTTPAVGYWGVVYVGGADGKIYALDRETGAEEWVVTPSGGGYECSTPTLGWGTVYVGCDDTYVYALDRDTGGEIWRYPTGDYVRSSPAVVDGMVYVGSNDGKVYALGDETGDLKWTFPTGGPVVSSPAVAVVNGMVYVGSLDKKLYALTTANGNKVWEFATGDAIVYGSPAVADGMVYIGSFDGNLYALNALTGAWEWTFPTGGVVAASPSVADGVVYIGTDMGNLPSKLYALDAQTGAQRWAFTAGNGVDSTPSIANGVVYVGSLDGNVYAIGTYMDIEAHCPVDLMVKDPGGHVITKTSNDIPGARYIEKDLDGDGSPDALVIIPIAFGNYQISVTPKAGADPADTYTLTTTSEGVTVSLAENVPIGNIYKGPYRIQVTDTGGIVVTAYSWSGYLPPISASGKPSEFKKSTVVPVKFRLTGASAGITDAIAQLSYAQVVEGVEPKFYPAKSVQGKGNQFRYDPTLDQYVFNWNTRDLSDGTYQLKVDMGDNIVDRTVTIVLVK